jgi:cytoskeletal protein CcmA (bactofilin family)
LYYKNKRKQDRDMDPKPPVEPEEPEELNSLDQPSTVVEGQSTAPVEAVQQTGVISAEGNATPEVAAPTKPLGRRLLDRLLSFNIYLLLFIFILVVAGVIIFLTYNYSRKQAGGNKVNTTTLSQDTLDKLANSDATVGGSGQVLNVQSSAVFAGKVLARSDLEVAGNLQLGGSLNLPNIAVNDTANLGQVTVSKNLAVTGNVAVQGQQTIAGALQVGGTGRFTGALSAPQISTNSLQLNGDFILTRHLTIGGGTPSRSNGTALGSGGTASVSGSDTAGSVSINTGGGPGAGCFVTVTFTSRYNATPHVIVTPVGSAAGGLAYYINRSTTNFSICTSSAPPANTSFGFDYFVTG